MHLPRPLRGPSRYGVTFAGSRRFSQCQGCMGASGNPPARPTARAPGGAGPATGRDVGRRVFSHDEFRRSVVRFPISAVRVKFACSYYWPRKRINSDPCAVGSGLGDCRRVARATRCCATASPRYTNVYGTRPGRKNAPAPTRVHLSLRDHAEMRMCAALHPLGDKASPPLKILFSIIQATPA